MQLTYLVLAHQNPQQLSSLLDLLLDGEARAVVHVDAKVDAEPFLDVVRAHAPAARATTRRHPVRWGGFGVVAATLTALREAVQEAPADHYVLLSGSDLPVRPASELRAELASGHVRMNSWLMPDEARGKPMSRLEQWHYAPRNRHSRVAHRVNRLLGRLPARKLTALEGAVPHAGSQWWTMPHPCAKDVLDFVDTHPRLVRFFRHVQVPDEMFFQTVVDALPHRYELRPNLTFTRWTSADRLSPDTLSAADLPAATAAGAFFARKFDVTRDPAVLDHVRPLLVPRG
ncbi:beta-1,6-N-acetylglucosaminyltransferase [Kineococcus sp. NPDC059986]|uniref:beta-1,6-N-acetylglucosaminyltransferase n=1 Tax=Kineococcus sp. NPDC059986 TaxID=3155538 RepID=UPI00344DC1C9